MLVPVHMMAYGGIAEHFMSGFSYNATTHMVAYTSLHVGNGWTLIINQLTNELNVCEHSFIVVSNLLYYVFAAMR